ncbi:hypothetical protein IF2G_00494 [Cordyceps javanica]|nr:hypothetical protein IF2G_00494 [Cordyceps javanica]
MEGKIPIKRRLIRRQHTSIASHSLKKLYRSLRHNQSSSQRRLRPEGTNSGRGNNLLNCRLRGDRSTGSVIKVVVIPAKLGGLITGSSSIRYSYVQIDKTYVLNYVLRLDAMS